MGSVRRTAAFAVIFISLSFQALFAQNRMLFNERLQATQSGVSVQGIEQSISSLDSLLSSQTDFTKQNVLVWEKYNLMCELDKYSAVRSQFIIARYRTVIDWLSKNVSTSDDQTLLSCADIMSCTMSFLSKAEIMKQGLNVKRYYQNAVKLNPDNVVAAVNLAQWFYYAPAIGGGSHKKCYSQTAAVYEKVSASPENYSDYEKMYVYTVHSQCLFEQKLFDQSQKVLLEAQKYGKKVFRVQKCLELNRAGRSWFQHCSSRTPADVDYTSQ